jgi:hypothetical protein
MKTCKYPQILGEIMIKSLVFPGFYAIFSHRIKSVLEVAKNRWKALWQNPAFCFPSPAELL